MPINVIVQVKKLKNKKNELNKRNFPIFTIENGEMFLKLKLLKI